MARGAELHTPSSEVDEVDDSGPLHFALSLIAIDTANAHTDREWILRTADTAHLANRQTPTPGSSSLPVTSVTPSPQWQRLSERSPMAVLDVFWRCITATAL